MPPRVLIGLITCRRPQMLSALLASLGRSDPAGVDAEILVVDNDGEGSARAVVEAFAQASGLRVTYAIEPRRGIPFARNHVLAFARLHGFRFVAMADDDVQVRPDWVARLMAAMSDSRAEAACGAVRFTAEAEPGPVGRELLRQRNGKRARAFLSTCCCLLDREFLDARTLAFDERFALTGGSDTDLFRRLRQAGGRIALVNEPLVVETVPASRLTLSWQFSRSARVAAFRTRGVSETRGRLFAAMRFLPEAAGTLALGGLQLALSPFAGLRYLLRATKKAGSAYGLALGCFGVIPAEYERIHGS